MSVYEYVPLRECIDAIGKLPIGTGGLTSTRAKEAPNYWSRLVAKEYRVSLGPELFAATQPV